MASDTDTKTDPEAGRIQSLSEQLAELKDGIMTEVRSMFDGLKSGASDAQGAAQKHEAGKLERPSDTADGLEAMVNGAIDRVLAGRDAQAADAAHRAQHEQLAAASERKPMERTRRHKAMGWGEPAE